MKSISVSGSTTTHGGEIFGSGNLLKINSLPAIINGDVFNCPDHGYQTVISSTNKIKIKGVSVVRDGDFTTCGAQVISTTRSSSD